ALRFSYSVLRSMEPMTRVDPQKWRSGTNDVFASSALKTFAEVLDQVDLRDNGHGAFSLHHHRHVVLVEDVAESGHRLLETHLPLQGGDEGLDGVPELHASRQHRVEQVDLVNH